MKRYKDEAGSVYQIIPRGIHPFKKYEFWRGERGVLHYLPIRATVTANKTAQDGENEKLAEYAAENGLKEC